MAAAVQTETVAITINDIELHVPKGELIVESVKRLGLEIPIFCYHPRMKPVGMCRMCLVEVGFKQPDGSVRKMPKPQAGCTLPASDGMVVYTDTEMVHRDRKGVLEFLLINHPLDCPICDRGGECPLQNNTLAYGPSTSRFLEVKRHLPKAYPLSEYVTLDLERCIQCGRCVRFTEEISGDSQLAFRFRGAAMQPSTFQLTDFESRFSGNVIEICPVGALTSSKYRFRARPWDLETRPGICTLTPCGTNVYYDYRSGRLMRINGRTNEDVNEEWTSDTTKFGHDALYNNANRIQVPHVREGDSFRAVGWSDAYAAVLAATEGKRTAVLAGTMLSNEDYFAWQSLARTAFATNHLDLRWQRTLLPSSQMLKARTGLAGVQYGIADLENAPAILVFGTNLAADQPMSYLRTRKAWFRNGARVVVAHHEASEAESFAHVVLRYRPGTAGELAAGLAHLLAPELAEATRVATPEWTEAQTGVPADRLREAAEALRGTEFAAITTHGLLDETNGVTAYQTLALLASHAGGKFNGLVNHANEQGGREMGFAPDLGPGGEAVTAGMNTAEILNAAAKGEIDTLILVGCDPIRDFHDVNLATQALEGVANLVVVHSAQTEACAYASAILPMALPAERDGTYTSCERRVQRMARILNAPGESKAPWQIAMELGLRSGVTAPYFHARDVMNDIAARVPAYSVAAYDAIPETGIRLENPDGQTRSNDAVVQALQTLLGGR